MGTRKEPVDSMDRVPAIVSENKILGLSEYSLGSNWGSAYPAVHDPGGYVNLTDVTVVERRTHSYT